MSKDSNVISICEEEHALFLSGVQAYSPALFIYLLIIKFYFSFQLNKIPLCIRITFLLAIHPLVDIYFVFFFVFVNMATMSGYKHVSLQNNIIL